MLRMRRQNCYTGKCSEFNQSALFVLQTIVNQVYFSNPSLTQGAIVYARKDEKQRHGSAYAPCLRFPVSSCPIFSQSSWLKSYSDKSDKPARWAEEVLNEDGSGLLLRTWRLNCSLGVPLILAWAPMIYFPEQNKLSLFLDDTQCRFLLGKRKVSWWSSIG